MTSLSVGMDDYFFRDSSPPPPPPQRLTESSETFRAQKEPPAEGEFQGKVEQLMWTTDEIQAALLRRARVQVRDVDTVHLSIPI